ncbi:MBL fold metallo-hydrolase [Nocardioides yefusunii]|uniref:MBL fold metallo-hydrolase n=1 Tax=Nocardioides yefusunii TaxID=2500546 RepID=A0ABW1R1P9_9ACTN|nr:MBL fold metallo-hydrolase [Nocardioides yefusunii]
MRITKFGHACVRIEHDNATLVVDPGGLTDAEAVDGATGVLITHEHFDHYSADHLRRVDAPIFTVAGVAAAIAASAPDLSERVTVVAPGETFTVSGVTATAIGEQHAVIHPELPMIDNSGFLFDLAGTAVFHPGDSLVVPTQKVDLLLAPASAPWLKASEAVEFVRAVAAARNVPIHDAIYTAPGHGVLDNLMNNLAVPRGLEWTRVAVGEDVPGL